VKLSVGLRDRIQRRTYGTPLHLLPVPVIAQMTTNHPTYWRIFMASKVITFEIYRSPTNKQWYWRLRARNGKAIAVSGEGYLHKRDVTRGLNKIISDVVLSNFVIVVED
jgi:uncharacterized protein YegP (UPF0339 family)